MKIIILGAGHVGSTLAEHLATENNDITVIDIDHDKIKALQDRLDLRAITGNASYPTTMHSADAENADMLIAVTGADEINLVACQIAQTLFKIPTKIARVRSQHYLIHGELFDYDAFPVDVLISPEQLVTNHITRLIKNPSALQVLQFAKNKLTLVAVKAFYGGPLIGHAIKNLKQHMPNINTRIVAIFRNKRPIIPEANTIIEPNDEVFFLASPKDITKVMSEMRHLEEPNKKIIIAGGGNIGSRLARNLENEFRVKLIENSSKRLEYLAENLDNTLILTGDCTEQKLLTDEDIEYTDIYCAVTNSDEANILSAILAKRLGAKKVMALISKPAYVDIVEGGEIDIAISPQATTISSLLTHVRGGDVVKVHSLRRGAAEAIEAIAHGSADTSKVIGRKISEINLPLGSTIGAIVRQDEIFMDDDEVIIEDQDHVIVFVTDKKNIKKIENLFQEI